MNFFFIFSVGMSFFMCLLLLNKRQKHVSDYLLLCWLGLIGLHLLAFYLFWQGEIASYSWLMGLSQPFPLLHGPLLFLYILSLVTPAFRLNRRHLWHAVPAILMYGFMLPLFFGDPQLQAAEIERYVQGQIYWYEYPFVVGVQLSGLIYAGVSLYRLQKHRHNLENWFASRQGISLKWLQGLILGLLGVGLVVALSMGYEIEAGQRLPISRELTIFSGVALFVLLLGYFGIRQQVVFSSVASVPSTAAPQFTEVSPPVIPDPSSRSTASPLATSELAAWKLKLKAHMEEEHPYLEPRLTLPQLAEQLDLSTHALSQLINQAFGQNFYQIVNAYRVQSVQEKMSDPAYQHLTLLALGLESGFNAKSTFNEAFKKMTGITPSQYRKSLRTA
jgi:AraC-like DNA-binding protein